MHLLLESALTYQAILHGNTLQWEREAPPALTLDKAVAVQVTVLEDMATRDSIRGERIAQALEKLAQSPTFAKVDGAQWQHEVRADRALPGRD